MKTLILTDNEAGLAALLIAGSMAVISGRDELAGGIWMRADNVAEEVWESLATKISAAGMTGTEVEQLLAVQSDILMVQ